MKTGLSKKQKATNIYFNEADSMIEVCTYNTALKNRLTEYAGNMPLDLRRDTYRSLQYWQPRSE